MQALKQAAVATRRSNCRAVRTFASTMQVVGNGTEVSAPGKIANYNVEQLRKEMAAADGGRGVSAYIIPSEDPHMVRLSDLSACHYLRMPPEFLSPQIHT